MCVTVLLICTICFAILLRHCKNTRVYLLIIGWRGARISRQIRAQSFRVRWMRHMIVSSFHHLELHLMFLLQRYWPQRRDAKQRGNVCFRCGIGVVIIVRLSAVKDVSVRLGRRYLQTCSDNYLLGNGFQRGHAPIRKLRDETIGSGRCWRAGICRQRRRSTAD